MITLHGMYHRFLKRKPSHGRGAGMRVQFSRDPNHVMMVGRTGQGLGIDHELRRSLVPSHDVTPLNVEPNAVVELIFTAEDQALTDGWVEHRDALNAHVQSLGMSIDRAPLHEQAWLWDAPRTVPFKIDKTMMSAVISQVEPSSIPNDDGPYATLMDDFRQAIHAWWTTPLVWRVHDGVAQAVLLGSWRFTWSREEPNGRCEVWSHVQGWSDTDPCFLLDHAVKAIRRHHRHDRWPSCLISLAEQMGRHAQCHSDRPTMWERPNEEHRRHLSWWPEPLSTMMGADQQAFTRDIDGMLARCRPALRAFGHALARLDPFWRTVARTLVRGDCRYDPLLSRLHGDPMRAFLQRWNDWSRVATEHPRAHLLLAEAAIGQRDPGVHTWRQAMWANGLNTLRPAAWRTLRDGPLMVAKTVTMNGFSITALDTLALLDTNNLNPEVLRFVPHAWWEDAQRALQTHHGLRTAMATFEVRRIKAFLEAAQTHPWEDQRVTMVQWFAMTQPVVEWLSTLEASPVNDPSWAWGSMVKAWFEHETQEIRADGWEHPFKTFTHNGVLVHPVSSAKAWSMLGGVMHNCLKDERSERLQKQARDGSSVLLRLSDASTSAVLFTRYEMTTVKPGWVNLSRKATQFLWRVDEHWASHNHFPSPTHQQVAKDVLYVLNDVSVRRNGGDANDREVDVETLSPIMDAFKTDGRQFLNSPSKQKSRWVLPLLWFVGLVGLVGFLKGCFLFGGILCTGVGCLSVYLGILFKQFITELKAERST